MSRPVTLFTGQWADLPFETLCAKAKTFGYDGLEIACWGDHMDPAKGASDPSYIENRKAILAKNGLKCWAISGHLPGQCVGDLWDPRLDGFAPSKFSGNPEKIREWAIAEMKLIANTAKNLGVKVVTGFMGSPIWKYWYSFPQTSEDMVDKGFKEIVKLWTPIFDEYDKCGIKFALEVHPTEIAFDYYSAERLLKEFDYRPTLGFNFDPSHLIWQGVSPHLFLRDFKDRIYHVHMKDAAVTLDGKAGILGSHITFGDTRRGWNFRSLGHGDVDFENIIRELNAMDYQGPLSVEWEDSGMEREFGATEACAFVRKTDFAPSNVAFDDALKKD
ncbi:sugar phosphate isomerase/epimerase family protein [Leadbettera azotonutricia]|uniref:Xylose isomerase domain protein TIM barrel n=1 Tax=Leadbettera azotonutricia (strain ATCC BAA-888 / DSM 13862 / ZAS-9) TaxID=545695 RepID=F5YBZ9_LEAAZ|nr:sugar phosphate isomerase/epimerase [Leadbettera azotonutricia]AEF81440.1 xylose isomerase domain protein TIM barrel [Leadbettera azotonutricia ZAS-9]